MTRTRSVTRLAFHGVLGATLIASASIALAQTKEHAPVAMKSAAQMTQDKAGRESWTYAQPRDVFTKYRTVIVAPTEVYKGPDAQFGDISAADRVKFAAIVT